MAYNPTEASAPPERRFRNVMRCIANEVITMAEAVSRGRYYQGLPEGVGENEPYWDFYFEALDAKWLRDGSWLAWPAAGRLYDKTGAKQDNTQRPYLVSVAYAGLVPPVSVFPGDPEGKHTAWIVANAIDKDPIGANSNYDASQVVGRVFTCELMKLEVGRAMPLPLVAHPEGYIFTDKIRELGSSTGGDVNADGAAAPASNTLVDIVKPGGEEALKQLLSVLDGQPADADLFELLRASGMDNRTLIDGESVLGAAVNDGALPAKLEEAGHVTIVDGKILRTADQNEAPANAK